MCQNNLQLVSTSGSPIDIHFCSFLSHDSTLLFPRFDEIRKSHSDLPNLWVLWWVLINFDFVGCSFITEVMYIFLTWYKRHDAFLYSYCLNMVGLANLDIPLPLYSNLWPIFRYFLLTLSKEKEDNFSPVEKQNGLPIFQ